MNSCTREGLVSSCLVHDDRNIPGISLDNKELILVINFCSFIYVCYGYQFCLKFVFGTVLRVWYFLFSILFLKLYI